MSRILGVDLGARRIGLAVADDGIGAVLPLRTISRARSVDGDARTIARIVDEERIDELVIGLPLNADGTEGSQAAATRAWADALGPAVDRPAGLRDERLTSQLAAERVGRPPRGRSGGPPTASQREQHRRRIDREAAALILEAELHARRSR